MITIYGRINTIADDEVEADEIASEVLLKLGITDCEANTYKYEKTYVELENHYMTDFKTDCENLEYDDVIRCLDDIAEGRVDDEMTDGKTSIVDSRNYNIEIENVFWILVGCHDQSIN